MEQVKYCCTTARMMGRLKASIHQSTTDWEKLTLPILLAGSAAKQEDFQQPYQTQKFRESLLVLSLP